MLEKLKEVGHVKVRRGMLKREAKRGGACYSEKPNPLAMSSDSEDITYSIKILS